MNSSSHSDFQVKHTDMEYVQVRENTPEAPREMSTDISTGIVSISLCITIITVKMWLLVEIPLHQGSCNKYLRKARYF